MKGLPAELAAVGLGGAIGASMRYLLSAMTHQMLGHGFPYGTLMVNVVGSLLIGYLMVLLPESDSGTPVLRLLLVTGLLGGFTTYSAFSVETLRLAQTGFPLRALANIGQTLVLCLAAVWVGYHIGRALHGNG